MRSQKLSESQIISSILTGADSAAIRQSLALNEVFLIADEYYDEGHVHQFCYELDSNILVTLDGQIEGRFQREVAIKSGKAMELLELYLATKDGRVAPESLNNFLDAVSLSEDFYGIDGLRDDREISPPTDPDEACFDIDGEIFTGYRDPNDSRYGAETTQEQREIAMSFFEKLDDGLEPSSDEYAYGGEGSITHWEFDSVSGICLGETEDPERTVTISNLSLNSEDEMAAIARSFVAS